MKALPQAIAGANFHSGIIAGKLNGVMPATTPSGWRIEYMSMPGPAPSVNSPFSRCGMPQANSTTSTPRWMSPLASAMVLPCSRARSSASSSMSLATRSRNFIITRARRCGFVAAHAGCAALAFSTAARSSAFEASATWPDHLAGHGLEDVGNAARCPGTCLPPMKCPTLRMAPSPALLGYNRDIVLSLSIPHGYGRITRLRCAKMPMPIAMQGQVADEPVRLGRSALLSRRRARRPPDGRPPASSAPTMPPSRAASPRLEALSRPSSSRRRPQGYTLTEHGERLLAKAETMETAGAGGRERYRRRGSCPLGHRPLRRARRLRHHLPGAALAGLAGGIPGLELQLVAMPRLLALPSARPTSRSPSRQPKEGKSSRASSPTTPRPLRDRPIISTRPSHRLPRGSLRARIVGYIDDLIFMPGARLSRRGLEGIRGRGCKVRASSPR